MSLIHLACAADERYLPHCAAMLRSVFESNAADEVVVHFMHSREFPLNQLNTLSTFVTDAGAGWHGVCISDGLLTGLPSSENYPSVVWQRVLLPILLPDVDKVLYLDSDVIVLGSLLPLWNLDISDYYVAAVTNPMGDEMAGWPQWIGLPNAKAYFNNGVMVMNLRLLRADNATEKILRHGVEHPDKVYWPEQCAMNVVLHGRRYALHPKWNVMNNFITLRRGEDLISPLDLAEALARPQIIHFEGAQQTKPWHYRSEHPYRNVYLMHRQKTPWPLAQLEGRTAANFVKRRLVPARLLRVLSRLRQRNHTRIGRRRDAPPRPGRARRPSRPDPRVVDWDSSYFNGPTTDAVRGGAAIGLSQIGLRLIGLSIMIVLARLLTQDEFGAVALITAVLAVGFSLQEAGLSAATVQRERVSTQAISSMFWINALIGLTLTSVAVALSPALAEFYRRPDFTRLFQATSLTFLLTGLAVQPRALLQRSMRFTTTAKIDVAAALVGGAAAIALALNGFGYWSLVAQILLTAFLTLVMLVRAVRWPLVRPALTPEVRSMIGFGASTLGFNLVVAIASNLNVVLLGRTLGASAAGIYTRAFALANVPQGLLHSAAAHVALPKLSQAQRDDGEFTSFYYNGVRLLTLVTTPVALAFALFSDSIALVVYGPQWDAVADLLQIFSLGLAVGPLLHSTGPVFLARNEPRRLLRWGLWGAVVIVGGTLIGLSWGIIGVAWGWSAALLVLVMPCLYFTYRGTPLTIVGLGRAVGGIYAAGLCTLPLGWLAERALADTPPLVELLIGLGATMLAYVSLCYFAFGQKPLIRQVAARLRARS